MWPRAFCEICAWRVSCPPEQQAAFQWSPRVAHPPRARHPRIARHRHARPVQPAFEPTCEPTCGVCQSLSGDRREPALYEDDLWVLRPASPPGVPGWMMMIPRRHVGGPAHFDDREARAFGPALRHFERVLERVTGALRIYTAALGESHPHFHAHMVPRYATMPRDARAWSVFALQRAVAASELTVAPRAVAEISAADQRALTDEPPPGTGA